MQNLSIDQKSARMPSLFVGHGSPMNLVESNTFTQTLSQLGERIKPQAILVISAHWLDSESLLQNSTEQNQIYDFYGFPKPLFEITYRPSGWTNELSKQLELSPFSFHTITTRGLDHGTWAVLYHMYPKANLPVVQLSIPRGLGLNEYFEIGQKLSILREQGVLIIGSGNIVHNLRQIDWNMDAPPMDWSVEFDKKVESHINAKQFDRLLNIDQEEKELFNLSHPTTEHYVPLAYILGTVHPSDQISYPCQFIQNGSISMRSVLFA